MAYFKRLDVFFNLVKVYESEEPEIESDIQIDEEEFIDSAFELNEEIRESLPDEGGLFS